MDNFEDWTQSLFLQDDDQSPPSGAPLDATPNVNADDPVSSPTVSPTPDGSIAKPIRRRSRASKKSPSTLKISANPDNFRSLVQKFTGCSSGSSRKGPITLNFADYNHNDYNDTYGYTQQPAIQHQSVQSLDQYNQPNYSSFSTTSHYTNMEPFAATSAAMDPLFVPNADVPSSRPDEQFSIDEDLEYMLQDLSEPGNYTDFPAGSSNNNDNYW